MPIAGEIKNPSTITIVHNGIEYTDIVPQNYKLDPQTEDLYFADELENGMRVLMEDGRMDEDLDADNPRILVRNRWCTVKRFRAEATGMYFIGVHDDGDMCIRQTAATSGWIVKKDSIPVHEEPKDEYDEDDERDPTPIATKLSNNLNKAFDRPRTQRPGSIETHAESKNVASGGFEV